MSSPNSLGIYFGPMVISIAETKGKQLFSNIHISRSILSAGQSTEEKVTEEAKIISLIKDQLREKKVEARDTTLSLSGKDLIIRSFEMAQLAREEMLTAINFEVRKYIPFKIEELTSDAQWQFDRSIQKNRVLFMGLKKESLDKYLSILKELNLNVQAIEYSAFSIFRLLKLAGIQEKGVIAIFNIDLSENDEINFVVWENGFPLFSRDITLTGEVPEGAKVTENQPETTLEKLRREIRISLDYYDRTFPLKSIKKIFFIMDRSYQLDLEVVLTLIRDMGLSIQILDVNKFIGRPLPFSLPFIRAYACSLPQSAGRLKINLLAAKEKSVKKVIERPKFTPNIISRLHIDYKLIIASSLLLALTLLFNISRTAPLKKELRQLRNARLAVLSGVATKGVSGDSTLEDFTSIEQRYQDKLEAINNIVARQIYVTELLDVLPRILPKEIRLEEVSFKKIEGGPELTLRGIVSGLDSNRELDLVNVLLSRLKENANFNKYFKNMSIVSADSQEIEGATITNFTIVCRN